MKKNIAFAICGCLFYAIGLSQSNTYGDVLSVIEQNNRELMAFKSFVEGKNLLNKTKNNLSDPQLSAYYLPFSSDKSSPDYSEFEVSQSFEFPTVYGARKKWNSIKAEQLENEYLQLRQNVLLQSSKLLIELISLKKQRDIEVHRHQKSKKVYEQVQELYNKEQVGILELNKAKVAWMQIQFHVERVYLNQASVLNQLENLNGGETIFFNQNDFLNQNDLTDFQTLWIEKLERDPVLGNLKANETASLQRIKVEKQKTLPNLTFGYNNQGISGDRVSGVLGGVSIPLWNNKNKVKAAQENHKYQIAKTTSEVSKHEAIYYQLYNTYVLLVKKYKAYKTIIEQLNSEELIYKAYALGEFSFMQYYIELEFFHDAYDEMLAMELELQQVKAELLKHKL